jgi:tetratricopeptide (TPR) repeat protein
MASRVLWEIDNEISGHTFERLCVDLLHRNGYHDIIPIEPQDGGRDAEETPRLGRSGEGHPAYFQFSLEDDWKAKLRRDAKKLESKRSYFDTLVFVTSQTARGVDTDALRKEFREQYGLSLFVYGREWLRFQLEEKHPDLALRHLGVEQPQHKTDAAAVLALSEPVDEQLKSAKRAIDGEDFDLGNAQLKKFLLHHPDSFQARQLLAWSYYRQDRFDEALAEINRAQRLAPDDQAISIKACILAEKGIKEHDQSSLLAALDLMKAMLEDPRRLSWELYYNLGNVLGALHRHPEAIHYYRGGVAIDAKQPTLWKNLASALHEVREHEEEMGCLEKALELDPQQPEALVSKAVSLLMDFGKAEEAIPLFQFAMRLSPESITKWPHVLFWYALAQEKLNNFEEALRLIDESLEQQPGDRPSRHRKSLLLSKLLSADRGFEERAVSFWQTELAMEPRNFDARRELVKIFEKSNPDQAWSLVDGTFAVLDLYDVATLEGFVQIPSVALDPLEYLPQYRFLRIQQPISVYWDMEDPLNFGHAFEENTEVAARLTSYFAVAFGQAWREFSKHSEAKTDSEALSSLFDNLRTDILRAVAETSRCLGVGIGHLKADVGAMSTSFASAIIFFNTVALREFAWQRGTLMREFEIEDSVKENAMNGYDENQLNQDVLSAVIKAINDEARLFPEDEQAVAV